MMIGNGILDRDQKLSEDGSQKKKKQFKKEFKKDYKKDFGTKIIPKHIFMKMTKQEQKWQ